MSVNDTILFLFYPTDYYSIMLDFLSEVLQDYCNKHDLQHLSADDLLYESINHGEADCFTKLTIEQEEWLSNYIRVWDEIVKLE